MVQFLSLLLLSLFAGCTSLVGNNDEFASPPGPSIATVALNTATPKRLEDVTATANGSVDPAGTPIRYRFEWFREDALIQTVESAGGVDTLQGSKLKGQTWTVQVTPVTEDNREGKTAEQTFTVINTAPTVVTVAMDTYRPTTQSFVRAKAVGFSDDDGDADSSRFVWTIGSRTPIENLNGELDLAAIDPAIDPNTEELSLQVIPADDEDDNTTETITLGSFEVRDDITQWREVHPPNSLGALQLGVAFDEPNHRFIFSSNENGIWEYSEAFGFVPLDVTSTTSSFVGPATTGGGEENAAMYVLSHDFSSNRRLDALSLASRGNEAWLDIGTPPATFQYDFGSASPPVPTMHFDEASRFLIVHYGSTGLADVYDASDLSAVERIQTLPTFTAAGVQGTVHPSKDNTLLFFGGNNGATASPITEVTYDFSDTGSIVYASQTVAGALENDARSVVAFTDKNRGLIVGGFGTQGNSGTLAEQVWTFQPGQTSPTYQTTSSIDALTLPNGSTRGVAGQMPDGRFLVWPGYFANSAFAAPMRLLEVTPTGTDGYEWRSLLNVDDVPASLGAVGWDGQDVVVFNPDGTQPLIRYNETDNNWAEHSQYIDQSPGPRGNFTGGAIRGDDGTWVIGGTDPVGLAEDMVAWKHNGSRWTEHTLATSESEPMQRRQHAIFDYSCGSSKRVGVVGGMVGFGAGVATDETWLLSCASGTQDCAWTSVTGNSPLVRGNYPIAAYDGQEYVVLIGGSTSTTVNQQVWILNACFGGTLNWTQATVTPDPMFGRPTFSAAGAGSSLTPISGGAGSPEFVMIVGTDPWLLREISEGQYQWTKLSTNGFEPGRASRSGGHRALWDAAKERLVVIYPNGELWSLLVR